METSTGFKKTAVALDLALAACRFRQSPKTKFLHYFPSSLDKETIPIYENLCFSLALLRQKNAEDVLEGKELLLRLLPFQTPSGNFPVFLHDYPNAFDRLLPLKLAPLFVHIINKYGNWLGVQALKNVQKTLKSLLECARQNGLEKPYPPLWEARLLALEGQKVGETPPISLVTADDWFEWIVTSQLIDSSKRAFPIPYSSVLEMFLGEKEEREEGMAASYAIEWILSEQTGFLRKRPLHHPELIYTAALFPFSTSLTNEVHPLLLPRQIVWKSQEAIHSLSASKGAIQNGEILFELEGEMEEGREDLFEAAIFLTDRPDTKIYVKGKRATVFRMGEPLTIQTPTLEINLVFELASGKGDFLGHLSKANRPAEKSKTGPFDWQMGIRTLRREGPCRIKAKFALS